MPYEYHHDALSDDDDEQPEPPAWLEQSADRLFPPPPAPGAATSAHFPDCARCGQLVDELTAVATNLGDLACLRAWVTLQTHIAEHIDELPEYVSTCSNCREWQIALADEGTRYVSAITREVLEREARRHRAGHRIGLLDLEEGGVRAVLLPASAPA